MVHQLDIPFKTNVFLGTCHQDATFPLAITMKIVQETTETRYLSILDYYPPGRIHTLQLDPTEGHLVLEGYHPLQGIVGQMETHLMEGEAEYLMVAAEVVECLPVATAEVEYLLVAVEEHPLQVDLQHQVWAPLEESRLNL